MSTQKHLITLCFATVFTLGLAACGGGDAPMTSMMDGDVSLEGEYILSGTMIRVEDVPDGTMIPIEGGAMLFLTGLGTVECVSDDGCLGTVADGVLTIEGDLKIVSVDPALDTETATVLAGLAVDMLPEPTEPELTPAEQLMAAQARVGMAQTAVDTLPADATPEQVGVAYAELTAAQQMLAAAQNLPENLAASQMAEVAGLIEAAQMLVTALTQTSSQEDVDAANMAIASAQTALTGARRYQDTRLRTGLASLNLERSVQPPAGGRDRTDRCSAGPGPARAASRQRLFPSFSLSRYLPGSFEP